MVLFIAGTRAIAGGAAARRAGSNQANRSRVQLTFEVASTSSFLY